MMRTTIDLSPELHALTREIAHQQRKTMSQVINELLRLGLKPVTAKDRAGATAAFPAVSVGRPITAEDIRTLEDE